MLWIKIVIHASGYQNSQCTFVANNLQLEKKKKKKKEKLAITEMFCAQPDKERCFFGSIKRLKDNNGNSFVFSRIVMPDGLLCANAPKQHELSDNLDKMCKMIVDKGLHHDTGVFTEVIGSKYFLN